MIERSHWHPVALAQDVAALPVSATLLDEALVLWRDAAGQVQAWADRCPHRGARLSMGRVVTGRLECPYHGWQFAPDGACVHVPAAPAFTPPSTHVAQTHAVCEAHGLVWVCLQPGDPPSEPPWFAAEAEPGLRKLNCGPYDVATSAPRIVENFLDMAHFGFVHTGYLGSREHTALADYQVHDTPAGPVATGCRVLQPRSNLHSERASEVAYRYAVLGPYTAALIKVPEPGSLAGHLASTGYQESIGLFICPTAPEHSRIWFRLAVADFEASAESLRGFQDTIFRQDQPVLESQRPRRLPLDVRAERHSPADKMSSAYRRHLVRLGITFGVLP
ncbi:MAG: hypothetical protein RLZZ126_230 [Pseudomonadota bacterium]|jgi:phenylpropionate dioxygenase-like ring-hydroxylating dioxygenase large terminal subunit